MSTHRKEYMKKWRDSHKELVKASYDKWYKKNYKKYYEKNKKRIVSNTDKWKSENESEKVAARFAARYAVKTGKILKYPCEICGELKVEGHHKDYSKPLDVNWLCQLHHREVHKNS